MTSLHGLWPVILSGGAGTRLWPVSRELHPKPFMRMTDGQSLLQKALQRSLHLPGVCELITVTQRDLYFKTLDDYQELTPDLPPLGFLLEPVGRNTAAAVAMAALYAQERGAPEATLLVLAADHLMQEGDAFERAVARARVLAEQGHLVTFGMTPQGAETGFGYIRHRGEEVLSFVEKPDRARAEAFVASGEYLWNAGMFCWRADVLLDEMRQHAGDLLACVERAYAAAQSITGAGVTQRVLPAADFAAIPSISIDHALMEHSQRVAVVPADLGWSDVGSWSAMATTQMADAHGNRTRGDVLLEDVADSFIQSDGRLVAMIGLRDMLVIDTADALLIAHKDRDQEVRRIVDLLKARGGDLHRLHRTAHRPWGSYTVLEEGDGFKIKRIVVRPGGALSLQLHQQRSEHWVVVSGRAEIIHGDQPMTLHAGESTFIPAHHRHRLRNAGEEPLVMIEVQCGTYLGEDDIVRFEDIYGRVQNET